MFKKSILLATLLFTMHIYAYSVNFNLSQSYSVNVGSEPAAIFYDSLKDTYNIFCIGVDKNFNTIYEPDSGDVLPSWWILKISSENYSEFQTQKVMDFEFASIIPPVRFAFAPEERAIFIPQKGKIFRYNIDNYEGIQLIDLNAEINYDNYSMDYYDNMLLISQSSYFSQSSIVLYSLIEDTVKLSKEIGQNIIQSIFYTDPATNSLCIATISVGPFGKDSSMLYLMNASNGNIFYEKVIGNNANYIQNFQNKYLVITLMGSHKIIIYNLSNNIEYEIPTNTTGWNGPAVAKMFSFGTSFLPEEMQTWMGTATYNAENQIGYLTFNDQIEFNRLNDYLKINGKIEDFDISNIGTGLFVVSAQYLKDDYSPNDSVRVNYIDYSVGVEETLNKRHFTVFPNPTYDKISIKLSFKLDDSNMQLKIYDYLGNLMIDETYQNFQNRDLNFDLSKFSAGNYLLQLIINNHSYTNYFTIIK